MPEHLMRLHESLSARRRDEREHWIRGWWVSMRVTIVLLVLALPFAVAGVVLLPGDSPWLVLGAVWAALALTLGFFADEWRRRRRPRG